MKSKTALSSLLIVILLFLITPSLFAQKDSAPWKILFNGKNLDGWKMVGSKGVAYVQNGEIICRRTPDTPEHTFVTSNKKYSDFILEIDFKLDPPGFSTGVLIRCIDAKANPDTTKVRLYGYQVKIDDRKDRRWTGGIFDDFGGTWHWLYDLSDNIKAQEAFKPGEWNTFHIEAIGNNMKVWINDVPATNLINDKYTKGYIALKIHGAKANQKGTELLEHFRNIRIIDKNPERYARPMELNPKVAN
ncbi:MAG: DUF1080 domain-containing protein [Acidobacteria bacterium]|jgi:hypothetical protein|nr:DUF1080 domain-containing protein [Acidobacteriota bacterium]